MKKKFSVMVVSILLLVLPMKAFASEGIYPLKSQYSAGVESADASLFSNGKVEKPIETGFEKGDEIESIINGSQSDQLGVSEEAYSGKFSLKVQKSNNEIIPICDTEYFQTGYGTLDHVQGENIQPASSKCNFYTLKLKPMSNSETISFYVKVNKLDEEGNVEEEYALIKSDIDRDGIYSVGTDLSRGKWQTVQLNIADLDEVFRNGAASGLYIKANKGSQWLIDDISSGYKRINETEFDLNEFASENVIYSEDALRFANNKDNRDYNIDSRVVSGGINVSDQLSDIQISSSFQYSSSDDAQQEKRHALYPLPLESDNLVFNNDGGTVLCERVEKREKREELPTVPNAMEMSVCIDAGTEKKFRLILSGNTDSSKTIAITPESGSGKAYYLSSTAICTDWYEGNITITSTCGYLLDTFMQIQAIEYYTVEENSRCDLLVKQNGSLSVDLGEFTSDDRTNLVYELSCENTSSADIELLIELFEGASSEPYYATSITKGLGGERMTLNNILPKIRANTKLKITNKKSVIVRFFEIELLKLLESDWNKNIAYADYEIKQKQFHHGEVLGSLERRTAKSLCSEGQEYAVVYPDAEGLVNITAGLVGFESASSDIGVYRILNLSDNPASVSVVSLQGNKSIPLHYGMADYVVSTPSSRLLLPANEKVMLIGKVSYSTEKSGTKPVHYTFVDGMYDGEFARNGSSIIYSNASDNDSAYEYDLETKTSKKIANDNLICSSPDGTHLLLKRDDGTYYILNIYTNEKEETPLTGTYTECFFNAKNELFVINNMLSYCKAGELHNLLQASFTLSSGTYFAYDFDSTGEYLLWTCDRALKLFKNTNGIWNEIKSFNIGYDNNKAVLSNDISTAYISIPGNTTYTVDLNTQTSSNLFNGSISEMTDDNMLLFSENNYYTLYNPVTAEKYKLFNSQFTCDSITYNHETNMVTGIMSNSRVVYHRFTSEEPQAKYALSFDGRKSWYSYTGGRWQTVSNRNLPSGEELSLAGMTASAVNSIPASAYEKLYSNNTDVLTVDVAVYMYSDSQKRTPAIENIVVKTVEKDGSSGVYGTHIEKYNKDDYRKITSLFPIENFGSNAECYYLLYIGNEWLYTYKDNEIVKVNHSANTLLSDMSESWLRFKQYGMTAKELRNVPGNVLSQLFVNDDFANTEFGVIYVVKTKDEDAAKYVVNFRLGSSSNFITDNDVVLELTMSGGEVKIIDSAEFSATEIEDFLSWIEARQNGNGEIFYRLKNATTQHFINYYMINSISIYNGEEYRSKNQ